MGRYRVPEELVAGVYRAGVGHFKPGDEFELPDAASVPDEKPSSKYEPLDEEADAALVKAYPELAKAGKLKRLGAEPKPSKGAKVDAKADAAKAEKAGIDKTAEKHVTK